MPGVRVPAGAFGEDIGKATSELGAVVQQEADKQFDLDNKAEAQELSNELNTRMRALEIGDDDLVTFGTGYGFVSIRPDMRGLYYKAFHPKQCYLEVDGLNEVSGVYIREMLTPGQAAEQRGMTNGMSM